MAFKLVFPNGDRADVLLNEGVSVCGSAADAEVYLKEMPEKLCELRSQGDNLSVGVNKQEGAPTVSVNGTPVDGLMALRSGDQVRFGGVLAKVSSVAVASSTASLADPDNDPGATRARMAIPKFVLRGVSGSAFSKTYPISGDVVAGRSGECDITIDSDAVSRRHASIRPVADGLMIEDLDSANGTFINGERIQKALLKAGDELRIDTIRLTLVSPSGGSDLDKVAKSAASEQSEAQLNKKWWQVWK